MQYTVVTEFDYDDRNIINDPFGSINLYHNSEVDSSEQTSTLKPVHAETAYAQCCWCIPKLPEAALFKKWLPKHRHLIFGHFVYGLFLVFTTASTGTSLYRRCTTGEAIFIISVLLLVSICVGVPKMLSDVGIRNVGPAILSFLLMFATGLSLHQKPLVCGFTGSKRGSAKRAQANAWAIIVSLQVLCIILTILLYFAWHLKHKDEKNRGDEPEESDVDSSSDSFQGSPASVRWRTGSIDEEQNCRTAI